MLQAVVDVIRSAGVGRLAIEGDSMTVACGIGSPRSCPSWKLLATSALVETLRLIKDKDEVARLRQAVWQAEKAFAVLRATVRPEQTEKEMADELEHQMRLFGGQGLQLSRRSWRSGRGRPCPTPRRREAGRRGELLLVDWGADGGLYKSDLTRVLVTGRISPKLRRVYGVVLRPRPRRSPPFGRGSRPTRWTRSPAA